MANSRARFAVSGKLGLAVVLIVAALVRFYGLDRQGLWYDEQVSLLVAVGRISSYEYSDESIDRQVVRPE